MKFTIKIEVAVYESEGDMDDVLRSSLALTANSAQEARQLGEAFEQAVRQVRDQRSK